jgi:nucleoside-diphosphate-sugar epimerase
VFGERELRGTLDEEFGFRPDKIEDRAKLYAMCKIAQEAIIRITAETSSKSYGIIRLGTVLGERMPRLTAANIFIDKALSGEPITPFRHTQHRPMLYVDIQDVCLAFESFANVILEGRLTEQKLKVEIINLVSPHPITVIELARMIRMRINRLTDGKINPEIKVIDKGVKQIFSPQDKKLFRVDNSKARTFLGSKNLTNPQQSIDRIIRNRIQPPK